MGSIQTIASKVVKHWTGQRLAICAANAESITLLNERLSCDLPEEYSEFLLLAGYPNDLDKDGFWFLTVDEVRWMTDILRESDIDGSGFEHAIAIVDYLHSCWWYCLWVDGPWRGLVTLVLGDEKPPPPPLGTFAEFLELYLVDSPKLYPVKKST